MTERRNTIEDNNSERVQNAAKLGLRASIVAAECNEVLLQVKDLSADVSDAHHQVQTFQQLLIELEDQLKTLQYAVRDACESLRKDDGDVSLCAAVICNTTSHSS